jgi:protein TonB
MEKKSTGHLNQGAPVFIQKIFSSGDAVHFCNNHIMNQQTILQSNLLDIIFENRNKDYGAYTLRKYYQSRLSMAVLATVSAAIIFSVFLLLGNSPVVLKHVPPPIVFGDPALSSFKPPAHQPVKKIVVQHAAVKSMVRPEATPVIVASDNINKLPATPSEILPSLTGIAGLEMNFTLGEGEGVQSTSSGNILSPSTKASEPEEATAPLEVAEIMPQYPGGIAALLSFLKRNIHSPGDVEEGTDITVKVEFVVNYNGSLERFVVVKTGGEIFDNEVLRALKKMPLWIPGKSKGKNVSVYYTVPVKFTSEF